MRCDISCYYSTKNTFYHLYYDDDDDHYYNYLIFVYNDNLKCLKLTLNVIKILIIAFSHCLFLFIDQNFWKITIINYNLEKEKTLAFSFTSTCRIYLSCSSHLFVFIYNDNAYSRDASSNNNNHIKKSIARVRVVDS